VLGAVQLLQQAAQMNLLRYSKLIQALDQAGLEVTKIENNRANVGKKARFVLFEALTKALKEDESEFETDERRDANRYRVMLDHPKALATFLKNKHALESKDLETFADRLLEQRYAAHAREARAVQKILPLNRRQLECFNLITFEWAPPPRWSNSMTLLGLVRRKFIEMRPTTEGNEDKDYNTQAWQYRRLPEREHL
jgi:hypothetical protein